jgi:hypothetical protein
MQLSTILNVLPAIGPVVAKLPEFVDLFNEAVATLSAKDQATAKEALADIQADNDEGHRRLQEKLARAAKG